jgi:hypothetical protein
MMKKRHSIQKALIAIGIGSLCQAVVAAEDFRVRYNLAGTLGGEIFAPLPEEGLIGVISHTYVDGKKLTGNDGNDRTITLGPNKVTIKSDGKANITALALVKVMQGSNANERLSFTAILPYSRTETNLTTDLPLPPNLIGEVDKRNGKAQGIGDLELNASWLRAEGPWKMRIATSLVLPTGKYDANAGKNIGLGKFYTLRPEAQVTYQPTQKWAFSGKVALGLNTTNKDKDWHSGHWHALEAAAGYMTPIGPLGLHAVHVKQHQDDKIGPANMEPIPIVTGPNRFELTAAGVFFATRLNFIDANLAVQHMVTTSSRNARHSNFTQVRLIKRF